MNTTQCPKCKTELELCIQQKSNPVIWPWAEHLLYILGSRRSRLAGKRQ